MDGITILNNYEYLTNGNIIFGLALTCVLFLLSAVGMIAIAIEYSDINWKEIILLIIFIIGSIVYGCLIPEKKYETRYQVTVDNSVSMNEFQDKYEIIEVEGKIYTVRERVE